MLTLQHEINELNALFWRPEQIYGHFQIYVKTLILEEIL